jgi:tripartite ATP-independent transporter DctP family solute receptor
MIDHKRVLIISSFIVILFILYTATIGKTQRNLILAHNMSTDHPVHQGIAYFARQVEERSAGDLVVRIYPNGQLGSEKEILSLVQIGAITMTKVSTLSLESFSPYFGILNLPFLFRDKPHFHSVLDSEIGQELLSSAREQRLQGLTFYEAGARSFYSHKPIRSPEDIRGMKIRVMDNPTAIRMLELLGGKPTPMPYGEVYTALQQGVIDGAENNITALTVNRHGEVTKFYSLDQHIFAPDTLIISQGVYDKLTEDDKFTIRISADESKYFQRDLWNQKVLEYEKSAKENLGVSFIYPEKGPFIEKVSVLHEDYMKRGKDFKILIQKIKDFSVESP